MDAEKLTQTPLFEGLPSKDLNRIASMMDEVEVTANRPLAVEDTLGHEFFVLLDGRCEVRVADEFIVGLQPGDFFGEIALAEEGRRTASVFASSPARVAVMTRSSFRDMAARYPDVGQRLRAAIDERRARATS